MEIEKLVDIIPNPKGTAGELVEQLVKRGYDYEYALKIVNKHMFLDPPKNPPTTWLDDFTGPNPKFLDD